MIPKSKLKNKSLVLIAVNFESENKDDMTAYSGKINLKNDKLYFNRDGKDLFEITDFQERIEYLNKNASIKGDFYLLLSASHMSEDESSDDYIQTGLKWQTEE